MKIAKQIIGCFFGLVIAAQAANVLCVGINEYAEYTNLTYAENDATQVARELEEQGHTVTVLTGSQVTREALLAALADGPEIVYFAGHGEKGRLMVADGNVALDEISDLDATLFVDSCFVGGGLKANGTLKVMAAAKHEAFESDGHGLFTKHLLAWMAKGNDIESDKIVRYLEKNVRGETGGWQKPVLGWI